MDVNPSSQTNYGRDPSAKLVEAVPNPDPDCVFCVHSFLQARQHS